MAKITRPIAFYPELARELGSVTEALLYQHIHFWSDKGSRTDGFIYKSSKEIEEETALTEKQQRLARKKLIEKGWIEAKKLMANGSFTWHYKPLISLTIETKRPTGERPKRIGERPVRTVQKASSITEITTEITTERNTNDHFSVFWEEYPRKIGKGQARKAFAAALRKTDIDTILTALRKHKKHWHEPKFIPHPSTWLNGERWEDELEEKKKRSSADILLGKNP
jgi:hypothetical protein